MLRPLDKNALVDKTALVQTFSQKSKSNPEERLSSFSEKSMHAMLNNAAPLKSNGGAMQLLL